MLTNPAQASSTWTRATSVDGRTAAWVSQRGPVTLLKLDQRLVRLALHAGYGEPAGEGWRNGDQIEPAESKTVVGGFNGGFRLDLPEVGFVLGRRVGVPLQRGLASVVTYRDGRTDIGSWRKEVPRRGKRVASVLQNLRPLIDEGAAASNLESCVQECWGATLGGGVDVARSALGIKRNGQLVWAGGESISPTTIAHALLSAGVRRAVQLDINPEWVAGYLYVHGGKGLAAMQVTPSQPGIPGQLLSPYNRDFFTILAKAPMRR